MKLFFFKITAIRHPKMAIRVLKLAQESIYDLQGKGFICGKVGSAERKINFFCQIGKSKAIIPCDYVEIQKFFGLNAQIRHSDFTNIGHEPLLIVKANKR